jgi:hypothetical protein
MPRDGEVKSQPQRSPRTSGADADRRAAEIHTLIQFIYGELAVTRPWLASALPAGGLTMGIRGGSPEPSSPWMPAPWGW